MVRGQALHITLTPTSSWYVARLSTSCRFSSCNLPSTLGLGLGLGLGLCSASAAQSEGREEELSVSVSWPPRLIRRFRSTSITCGWACRFRGGGGSRFGEGAQQAGLGRGHSRQGIRRLGRTSISGTASAQKSGVAESGVACTYENQGWHARMRIRSGRHILSHPFSVAAPDPPTHLLWQYFAQQPLNPPTSPYSLTCCGSISRSSPWCR